ncbi:hypothetical protein [Tellurirhabdus rosea]|uniref:hypothetical protein n=1 Tax=Tellurirhabdus rosea TaxID=2674997 RepID=UPI00224CE237|nr:hypothetical protein [Tellurirhabdus rosea]
MNRLYIATLLLLTACSNPAREAKSGKFYDLNGFMERQIAELNQTKPKVDKRVMLNGEGDNQQSRTIDWKKELDLFVQADINKQAYVASYQVARPDSLTYEYQLKEGEKLPVGYLKIILDSTTRQPARVEAVLASKNYLYESKRMLWLETRQGQIRKYHIEGFQQLAWLDKKPFLIEGRIE